MENYSNEAILCKIVDNVVVPVIEKRNLTCVWNQQHEKYSSEMIFYIRNTCDYFLLNINTGEIRHREIKLRKNYVIESIYTDGDDILLRARKPGNNKLMESRDMLYICKYDDLM